MSHIPPDQACVNIPDQNGIFAITDESTWTHCYHSKHKIYIRIHLAVYSMSFDKCVMMCSHYTVSYRIPSLPTPCPLSVLPQFIPPSPLTSWNHWFSLFPFLNLSHNIIQLKSCSIYPLQIGFIYLVVGL